MVALTCVFAFFMLFTLTTIGQQGANTVRFLLGWQHIAQHQRQLHYSIDQALQKAELPPTVYHLSGVAPQRRGLERWQRQSHVISLPPELATNTFETLFQESFPQPPFAVFARRIRQTQNYVVVELTLGMAGVPTDTFEFIQPRPHTIASLQVPPSPKEPPHVSSIPVPQLSLPRVAIVIDDLGWDLRAARLLLDINAPLNFAILPNTPHRDVIAQEARQRGREILLHLPMEPYHYPHVNPGQPVLLSTMNTHELTAQLENALATLPGVIGVNNHMGSRLTEDHEAMRVVMQLMKHRNLFFLDSRTSQKSLAYQVARELGVRTAQRQVFLDNQTDTYKIAQQLHRLAALARESGSAIGIGHPYPETIQSLRNTLPEIRQTGVEIVPISRLVQ
jgi:hypothetical protein